ncbi:MULTISPECIES: prepilin peptidase [Gordonia]|uniref:prepilin peptidase n=1 Tax=Gordonia TaxID=2053 RepID=UPI0007EAE56D|nr:MULTISPECIES: prepilin peptidase [Gordonia]MCM3893930.1 prepilin peptidase [Gordonia sputi]OBA35446.1 peptidase A24 family protein [Gordonia sp. 852002-51296_SCH5728562-b]
MEPVGCLVALWLAALADIDRRTSRLPTVLLWPGCVAVGVSSCVRPCIALAAVAAAGPYLVGWLTGLCGGGDVKLAFALGGTLADPASALLMVLFAQVLGLLMRRGRQRWPHGPPMIASGAMLLVAGSG